MAYARYLQAIRQKVCAHCIERAETNECTLSGHNKCGVELYLPSIVALVQSIKTERLEDYVELLREKVCSGCKNKNPDGTCQLRSDADCGLDRYFALVIEAIEEVDRNEAKKT